MGNQALQQTKRSLFWPSYLIDSKVIYSYWVFLFIQELQLSGLMVTSLMVKTIVCLDTNLVS